jgi:fructan beta-fructosidase
MSRIFLVFFSLLTLACVGQNTPYAERYRPRFHFTPAYGWTNDPNGLVYANGEYHLFFQHNPFGNKWGHMSWGHAVSKDLVHWKHLPVAIPEENGTMIFSGSAVLDENNTAGFYLPGRAVPLVAVYTGHLIADSTHPDDYLQSQQIAFSLDSGRTFTKYPNNPVLDLHKKDFRDPCVFWYAPQKKWVMAVVLPHEHIVQFYASPNLINWTKLSEFGPAGDIKDIWECPSLLQVPVSGNADLKKWVLFNSQQTTMQYFVGEFDGKKFTNESPSTTVYRPDYGPDFYAGITYNDLPASQSPVLLGWANNWSYANDIPTNPWKSMMGIPRSLSLLKRGNAWILLQHPVEAMHSLRGKNWKTSDVNVEDEKELPVRSLQCEIELDWTPGSGAVSGIELAKGTGKPLVIGYDSKRNVIFVDRKGAGDSSFSKNFARLSYYEAPLSLQNNRLHLRVFVDQSIVEVFANDGEVVLSTQIFPDHDNEGISLFSHGASSTFNKISIWNLHSIW